MKKILLVKTSSLGDVVHNLPVVTDIARHFPDARIDWIVEEAFAALPALHPAVTRVIPVAIRRWRKHAFKQATWREIGVLRRLLDVEGHDLVIDTQGLLKSALITRVSSGDRHGYDAGSAREPLAAWFYDMTHAISPRLHAVVRNRNLAAAALGYVADDAAEYGIRREPLAGAEAYCVLLHATSRADKQWPEERWIALGKRFAALGLKCVLPCGSEDEFSRAGRLAAAIPAAGVAARLELASVADLLAGARFTIGVDTGLTHLSAALGQPTVAIYCASTPGLTGIHGAAAARNLGAPGATPAVDEVMAALNGLCPEYA